MGLNRIMRDERTIKKEIQLLRKVIDELMGDRENCDKERVLGLSQ